MVDTIILDGPKKCMLTTKPPKDKIAAVIVCDWLNFSMVSGFARIEMITGNVLTVWYNSDHTLIEYAPRELSAGEIDRMKNRRTE